MSDGQRIAIFGRSGSGKSTVMNEAIRDARRLIVFDYLPTRRITAGHEKLVEVTTIKELKKHTKKSRFRVWFRPDPAMQVEALHELSEFVLELQRPIEEGKAVAPLTLAIDEMSEAFPVTALPKHLRGFYRICKAGRHYRINVVGASQRPAQVNTEFRGNADAWFFLSLVDHPDLDAVKKIAGPTVRDRVAALPMHQYLLLRSGKVSQGHTKR